MFFNDDREYLHEQLEDYGEYLTPREVRELLCIGKNTFYKLINSGELKGFRVGRQWRLSKEGIRQFAKTMPG